MTVAPGYGLLPNLSRSANTELSGANGCIWRNKTPIEELIDSRERGATFRPGAGRPDAADGCAPRCQSRPPTRRPPVQSVPDRMAPVGNQGDVTNSARSGSLRPAALSPRWVPSVGRTQALDVVAHFVDGEHNRSTLAQGAMRATPDLQDGACLSAIRAVAKMSRADRGTVAARTPFRVEHPNLLTRRALDFDERAGAGIENTYVDDDPWSPLVVDNCLDVLGCAGCALQYPSTCRGATAALVRRRLLASQAVRVPKTTLSRRR